MAEGTQAQPNPPETEQHAATAISDRDLKWKEFRSRSPRLRLLIIIGVVVLLVVGFFLLRYFNSYQSTDDAQVDAHLNPVSARVGGHIEKLLVDDNQYVQAGQPLVQIYPRGLPGGVAPAKRGYDKALATAPAAGGNLPVASTRARRHP